MSRRRTPASTGNAPDENDGRGRRWPYARLAIPLVVVLLALVVFQYGLLGTARRLALVPERQPYTELYFEHPAELPRSLPSSGRLRWTFVIVDDEGAARSYDWRVLLEVALPGGRTRALLASGTATLSSGASRRVTVHVGPLHLAAAGLVQVALNSPSEAIDFHLRAS